MLLLLERLALVILLLASGGEEREFGAAVVVDVEAFILTYVRLILSANHSFTASVRRFSNTTAFMTWKSSVIVALCSSTRFFSFTMTQTCLPRALTIVKASDTCPTFNVSTTRATSGGKSFISNFDVRPSSDAIDINP